jgi:hypothetical protein
MADKSQPRFIGAGLGRKLEETKRRAVISGDEQSLTHRRIFRAFGQNLHRQCRYRHPPRSSNMPASDLGGKGLAKVLNERCPLSV